MFALAIAGVSQSATTPPQDHEAKLRAAILRASIVLKIAGYLSVDAPPPANPPEKYRIAVVGTDAVASAIHAHLPAKKVGATPVAVVEIQPADAAEGKGLGSYDLIYVAASVSDEQMKKIVAAHARAPVPLVCERTGFAAAGGTVQLFVQDNGVRFEVNLDALKKQGVRADPQLLKLSKKGPS